MAIVSNGIPQDRAHALELMLQRLATLIEQLQAGSTPDVIEIADDNGVTRLRIGAQDDGSWGVRIFTADPSDPNHLSHDLT